MALQIWDGGEQREMTPEEEAAFAPTLADIKAAAHDAVDARVAALFAAGYPVASGAMAGETLQVRNNTDRTNWLTSQAAYTAAIAAGQGASLGAVFRTTANRSFTLSFDDGLAVLLAMAAWGQGVYGWSWTAKDAIDAAADETALAAIDLAGGG